MQHQLGSTDTGKQDCADSVCRILTGTEVALRSLERKLASMATANGFASVSGEFIITAMTDVLNTSVTATAPPKFVSEVEVAVYVLNNPEQLIVDQKVIRSN